MAHFDHIKPGGVWSFFALLSSGIMSIIDKTLAKAINGDEGGTWTPQNPSVGGPPCPIIIGGDGLQVPGPFLATDAQIEITAGKFLTLDSGATLNALLGSTTNLRGQVFLKNTLDVGVAGGNIGKILLEASTYISVKNSASIFIEDGGTFDLKPNSLGFIEPNAVVEITGDSSSPPNLQFGNYGAAIFGGNAYCYIGPLGEFRIKGLGAGFVDVNGTFRVDGALTLTNFFTAAPTTTGTWHGTHVFKSEMVITSEVGVDITLAGVAFTGPITRSNFNGYDVWRSMALPTPSVGGTTVTINPTAKDKWVINLSSGFGVGYSLANVGVPDDVRVMFELPKNTWNAGAQIIGNGGVVLCQLTGNFPYPTSVVLYKRAGLWEVDSWSGVFGDSISFP